MSGVGEYLCSFGRWYWFHVKRALWHWNCKDRSFKRQTQELWSFIIVLVVYKVILIGLLLLVVLGYYLLGELR